MNTPIAAQFHEFDIPAGATRTAWGEGDSFLVVESNVRLEIMRDGAPFLPYEQGDREDLPVGISFARLEVRNPTLTPARVKIYSGYGRRIASRQAVMEPEIAVIPFGGTLESGASLVISSALTSGQLRQKMVSIRNRDVANKLTICDAAGTAFAVVDENSALIFQVSDSLILKNESAGPISFCGGRFIWHT